MKDGVTVLVGSFITAMLFFRRLRRLFLRPFRWMGYWRRDIHIARGTVIHDRARIGHGTRINAASHIDECEIGAYCAIGGRLVVRSSDHYANLLNVQGHVQSAVLRSAVPVVGKSKGKVVIGNNVWIGDSVIILPGVQIGDGAVIGAGSVVTKSVPAYHKAVGNPARVVGKRFPDEIIAIVENIRWWDWDRQALLARRRLFELDLETINPQTLEDEIAAVMKSNS